MSRRTPDSRPRARRRVPALPAVAVLLALAVLPALPGRPARAAEFDTPQGVDVKSQEAVLKEQVRRIAQDLVGNGLLDVIVSVRYVRTGGDGGDRIKLPGVNSYITPSGVKGAGSVVAGQARVRQVVVMVRDTVTVKSAELAKAIREKGKFDPDKGDSVRVIRMGPGGPVDEPPDGMEDDMHQLSQRLRRQKHTDELGRMMAQGSLAEAQATTFLIRARQAFFAGNYDRALDQILQSIEQNPNNPQAYAMLGSLYYAVDWKQLALKYWEKSLTLDPDNQEIQELVAKLRSSPLN